MPKSHFLHVSKLTQQWLDLATEAAQGFENNIEQLDKNDLYVVSEWHYWIREVKNKNCGMGRHIPVTTGRKFSLARI
ncbi:hypothetical protein OL548_15455 [Lysinibacillus sp. MHQ-1]|nr:hypothetical protein OL548_15455 [Lysinibacillus sp. MHQ-1]